MNYLTEFMYDLDKFEWYVLIFDFGGLYCLMMATEINIYNWIKVLNSIEIMTDVNIPKWKYVIMVNAQRFLIGFSFIIVPIAVLLKLTETFSYRDSRRFCFLFTSIIYVILGL